MQGSAAIAADREQARPSAEEALRKGDIVLLQAGDMVAADLELLEAKGLEVDEWELTGGLRPVEKQVGDEPVLLYQGSRVTRGSGKGVVVAAGAETEYGEILKQPWEQERRRRPPLIGGRHLWLLALLLPLYVAAVLRFDPDVPASLLFLAAAAAMTLLQNGGLFRYILASREAKRLEAEGIEVRDVKCLEAMGHLDVVCLDKTGVLTTRDIEVGGVHFAGDLSGARSLPAGERGTLAGLGCALCNDVFFQERRPQADPIDRALISFAAQQGFDVNESAGQYRRVWDKPFGSEDRYMAAGFELGNQRLFFAKGDPEVILRMCSGYLTTPGSASRLDGPFLEWTRTVTASADRQGDITIALAYSRGAAKPPERYTFLCLVRLHNPVRPEARDEILRLKAIGIRPVMLTGDRPEAAMAVGRQLGIGQDREHCLTGKEITRMALKEVAQQAAYVSVFARLLPSQKGVLVRLLQQGGHTVAMVGDGANDAVALSAADVGFSFGHSSSPFARRVSRILIHRLPDLLRVVTGAKRMEQRLMLLMLLRAAALIGLLSGLALWVLR